MDVFLPLIEVHPVDQALHRAASLAYRAAGWADVSFVDRTSFTFMRDRAIEHAFAFDDDFVRNGFRANEQPAADPSDLGR
jgi:predicted nucleic acid-binding protein